MSVNLAAAPDVPRVPLRVLFTAGLSVLLANTGLLVLQLVAPRLLAPAVGSSLETWTTVIGVFLTGIALGNWLGGRVADRAPSLRALGALLILGGALALSMIGVARLAEGTGFHRGMSLGLRIPVLGALLCLPVSFALSLITPLAIKLALPDIRRAGRVAGLVFALGTLGCLVGNYLGGFVLMANFYLDTIVLGVAGTLLALGGGVLALKRPAVRRPSAVVLESSRLAESMGDGGGRAGAPPRGWLDLRGRLPLAFLIVFAASFCGMTLELTGVRFLAPRLGVSLYTWTGIIGVMLAATATGNYLGGVLADRGFLPGLKFFGVVMGAMLGLALAPAIGREMDETWPAAFDWFTTFHQGASARLGVDVSLALIRLAGLLGGVGVALFAFWMGEAPSGLYLLGALAGALAAPPLGRGIDALLAGHVDMGWFPALYRKLSDLAGFDCRSVAIRGTGALAGLFVVFLIRLAGRLWDEERLSASSLLGGSLVLAALCTVAVVPTVALLERSADILYLGIVGKVLAYTFGLFFLPMMWLGTVSPQVIRLAVPDLGHAGRTAGSIYAVSTAGAIAGTFATGYVLISQLGVYKVLFVVAAALAVLGMLAGRFWRSLAVMFAASIVGGAAAVGLFLQELPSYDLETNYYTIQVTEEAEEGDTYRSLILDHLIHSTVKLGDPTFLHYTHEHIQVELTRRAMQKHPGPNVLVIGGGGYTFPRYLETQLPRVNVEVVEIDPGVTRVAHEKLGLPRDTKISIRHMDGRQFIAERAPKGRYHLVVQDAVNDLSVPYHLLTKEYNDAVKRVLTDDGVYLLTLIDAFEDGKLWRAALHTMRESFPHVYLLFPDEDWEAIGRGVFVIYGSDVPLDVDRLRGMLRGQGAERVYTHMLPPDRLEEMLAAVPRVVLTDQYAPVDNLMSGVFRANTAPEE